MELQRAAVASAVIAGAVTVAGAIAWASSQEGAELRGVPVMILCASIAFAVQWLAFVPAYWKQTEHFYDLVGSLTYMLVIGVALVASRPTDVRSAILGLLVFIWAARLGSFLFRRVRCAGSDPRFDEIKRSASRFVVAWTLQGLWVFLTLCAALAAITTTTPSALGALDGLGIAIWVVGFTIEVSADRQKSRLRNEFGRDTQVGPHHHLEPASQAQAVDGRHNRLVPRSTPQHRGGRAPPILDEPLFVVRFRRPRSCENGNDGLQVHLAAEDVWNSE